MQSSSATTGSSPLPITASVLHKNFTSGYSSSSSACIPEPNIPAAVSAWLYARRSLNATAVKSGLNPRLEQVRSYILLYPFTHLTTPKDRKLLHDYKHSEYRPADRG